MIRLAGQAISLIAALALTLVATAALTAFSTHYRPTGPSCLCFTIEPRQAFDDTNLFRHRPPPPLPKFIHPRAVLVKAPEILCEVPGEPTAVRACGVTADSTEKLL